MSKFALLMYTSEFCVYGFILDPKAVAPALRASGSLDTERENAVTCQKSSGRFICVCIYIHIYTYMCVFLPRCLFWSSGHALAP